MNAEEALVELTDVYNILSDTVGELEELESVYKKLDKIINWLDKERTKDE